MNARPLSLDVWPHALDPMLAQVRIRARWRGSAPAQIQGRLLGPKCPFSTTIELAYPLQILEATAQPVCDPTDPDVLIEQQWLLQALIPEPSLWEPQTPFVYEGPVEVWSTGTMLAREIITLGLKQPD